MFCVFGRVAGVVFVAAVGLFGMSSGVAAQAGELLEPFAPVNVRVVAEADGAVTVAWDVLEAEEGRLPASGYQVLLRQVITDLGAQPDPGRSWWVYWPDRDMGPDAREGRVWDLTSNVWYEVRVAAVHDAGLVWSEESVPAYAGSRAPGVRLAGAPSDVSVVGEGLGSVTVAWEPPGDDVDASVTGYEVWYIVRSDYLSGEGSWVMSGGLLGDDVRGWLVEGLVDFEEYLLVVAAVTEAGRGVFSRPLYAVPGRGGLDPPAAPTNIGVVAEGDGSVAVGWDAPEAEEGRPPPTGYRILYREAADDPGSEPNLAGWFSSSRFGFNVRQGAVQDLVNNTWYEFRVASVAGDWSEDTAMARPGEAPPEVRLPAEPANLRAIAKGPVSVTVVWDPPTDDGGSAVTGYEVWYVSEQDRSTVGAYVMSAETLPADTRQHTITGLVDYQRYQVIVAAVTKAGRGLFVSEWAIANRDDHDPAGLIADHRFARAYSLGSDIWEVWVCDVADGHLRVDVGSAVALLNREINPYFSWLSGGRYRPAFVAGGTVKSESDRPSEHAGDYDCDERVAEVSEGGSEGAVIVLDKDVTASSGGAGSRNGAFVDHIWQVTSGGFPDNGRAIELTASAVLPTSAYCSNCDYPNHVDLYVVAHEMGHALGWPHSYGGNRPVTGEVLLEIDREVDEYDNPMDMVSGSPKEWQLGEHGLVAGTIAANRYAAGWIDDEDVAFHQEPYGSYLLAPIGRSGIQMLVLPTGTPGHFISLGARVARGYDTGIPAEGVEVYRVDQRATVCAEEPPDNPDRLSCTGTNRRTRQVPPPRDDKRDVDELTDHVYGPGEGLTIEGFRVEVTKRVSGRYRVWVGNPYKGTFADDEGNVHESSVNKLAEAGVFEDTECAERRVCPNEPLLRWVMAVWTTRALNETPTRGHSSTRFADVDQDAWWARFVELLADLGITAGCKTDPLSYCPHQPVTRAQMATFLVRALNLDAAPSAGFADTEGNTHQANIDALAAAGITAGCKTDPLRYCPDSPVTRAQMATFLVRALRLIR